MAIIDIIILVVFAVAVITGYRKGFVAQAGSLAAILMAIIACRLFGPMVTDMVLAHYNAAPSFWQRCTASTIAYCGVYIVVYYAVVLVVRLLRMVIRVLMLGPLDSIGGALVSVFKWFMALSVAANLYIALFPTGNWLATSHICGGRPVSWITGLAPGVLGQISRFHSCTPTKECNDSESSVKDSNDETK